MMCGITGTPGTGKSTVADELARRGYRVVHITDIVQPYVLGKDRSGIRRLSIPTGWRTSLCPLMALSRDTLPTCCPATGWWFCACDPMNWRPGLQLVGIQRKREENRDAEALDVCLIETVEQYEPSQIFELDTTGKSPGTCADTIEQFYGGEIPASFGSIDWSAFVEVSP